LLHHDTSDIFQGEEDPDHQTYSHEKPIDVEKRAMEKLRQKMQFFDAYVEARTFLLFYQSFIERFAGLVQRN
jgi:hypothetical protein